MKNKLKIKLVQRDQLSCEAIVRRAPNGELLMVSQCGDISEPAPGNRVYVWHSGDDGETWSKRHLIIPDDGRAVYQTEVSVIKDKVFVYLTIHNGNFLDYENMIVISEDSGYTFNVKSKLPLFDGFTFIRGAIKTQKGQWLIPYQYYPMSENEDKELVALDKKIWDIKTPIVENGVVFADDKGNLLKKGGSCDIPLFIDGLKRWTWPEPTVIELSNGELVMLLRLDKTGYLYESRSSDGGITWSEHQQTDIPNPSNKPKLLKDDRGRIILLNTPQSTCGMNYRHPLEMWISDDDMKTWKEKISLVTFPGWISYPDGFIENNTLYLSFEFNRHDVYFLKYEFDK